jgi:hypothetical protein
MANRLTKFSHGEKRRKSWLFEDPQIEAIVDQYQNDMAVFEGNGKAIKEIEDKRRKTTADAAKDIAREMRLARETAEVGRADTLRRRRG